MTLVTRFNLLSGASIIPALTVWFRDELAGRKADRDPAGGRDERLAIGRRTHLALPRAAPLLVLSLPVLGGGAALAAAAAAPAPFLAAAGAAGVRGGRLADGALAAGVLRLGSPLEARHGGRRRRLLLLLRRPLRPGVENVGVSIGFNTGRIQHPTGIWVKAREDKRGSVSLFAAGLVG